MRNVLNKNCRENQNQHFNFKNFFPKILPFVIMSKNVVDPERPPMTAQYGAYALHAA
jgi:hypothetical protein